jgi:hypothetical protein
MESINIKLDEYPELKDLNKNPQYKNILQTIFRLGYNTYFNTVSNNLEYYTVKDDLMNTLNETIQPLNDLTKSLYGLNQSTRKGDITEALIDDIIGRQFPEYNYDIKRGIAHHADGELSSPTGLKALVEVKNHNNTVSYEEVDKFKYDLAFRGISYGLFISTKSGIQFQKPFSYEKYEKDGIVYHIVYVSKVFEEHHKIYTGVLLLENIYKFIKKNECSKIDKSILNNIKKIETIIYEFTKIKNKYLEMESSIKKSLDDYYGIIRDAEYQMKEKFNDVWNQIVDDDNKLIQYSAKESIILQSGKKIQNILEKVLNKFDNSFKYVLNEDEDILIYLKNTIICTIKLYKLKIVIRFMNYDLTISSMNDDTKLLEAYINNKKINI